jgi:hypothetical protein
VSVWFSLCVVTGDQAVLGHPHCSCRVNNAAEADLVSLNKFIEVSPMYARQLLVSMDYIGEDVLKAETCRCFKAVISRWVGGDGWGQAAPPADKQLTEGTAGIEDRADEEARGRAGCPPKRQQLAPAASLYATRPSRLVPAWFPIARTLHASVHAQTALAPPKAAHMASSDSDVTDSTLS